MHCSGDHCALLLIAGRLRGGSAGTSLRTHRAPSTPRNTHQRAPKGSQQHHIRTDPPAIQPRHIHRVQATAPSTMHKLRQRPMQALQLSAQLRQRHTEHQQRLRLQQGQGQGLPRSMQLLLQG